MHKKLTLGGKKKFEIKTSSKGYSIRQASGNAAPKTTATVSCESAAAAEREAKEIVKARMAEGYTPQPDNEEHQKPAPKSK